MSTSNWLDLQTLRSRPVMPNYLPDHWVTLTMKSLIINVTQHTPQNRVSDTIAHATLNTINRVVFQCISVY